MRTFFFGFLPFLVFSSFFRWYYVCKISNQCDIDTPEPIEVVEKPIKNEIPVPAFTQDDFHVDGADLVITQELVDYINNFQNGSTSMLEVIIEGNAADEEEGTKLGEDIKTYMLEEAEIQRPINTIFNGIDGHTGNTMQIKIKEY